MTGQPSGWRGQILFGGGAGSPWLPTSAGAASVTCMLSKYKRFQCPCVGWIMTGYCRVL